MTQEEEDAYVLSTNGTYTEEEGVINGNGEVSLNAIAGSMGVKTLKVVGLFSNHKLNILVDTGSTNSFISESLAYKLQCQVEEATSMMISVADGGKMVSRQVVKDFSWEIQGEKFVFPLRLLQLGGFHIVLGCDWLLEHNPIQFDYVQRLVTITKGDSTFTIKAQDKVAECTCISGQAMFKLLKPGKAGEVEHFFSIQEGQLSTTTPVEIEQLLGDYPDIFEEPTGLPPNRGVEHQIILKPDATPKQLYPYRYSHAYKKEIEQIVKELMDNGTIRHSKSPFAAPVLLVRKKDATWRMCVDYRYLNNLTVKHDFPIPIIDELLDELHGATWFTKLDLGSGYFQIRMKEDDIHKTARISSDAIRLM